MVKETRPFHYSCCSSPELLASGGTLAEDWSTEFSGLGRASHPLGAGLTGGTADGAMHLAALLHSFLSIIIRNKMKQY